MAREHRKLRHFSTAKKTRENTRLLYELSVILYFRRVFDLFFVIFLTVKCRIFDHSKTQVNYSDKVHASMRLSNASAIELHFLYQFWTFSRDLQSPIGRETQR